MGEQDNGKADTPTIHQALAAVMRHVGAIPKGQTADPKMGGYSYRGIDDLMNGLHGPLAEQGVVIAPEVVDREDSEYKTRGGTTMRLVALTVRLHFHGPAGDSLTVGPVIGEAADTGDKAANQALIAAYKYALFLMFCVPVDDVADADAKSPDLGQRQRSTPQRDTPKPASEPKRPTPEPAELNDHQRAAKAAVDELETDDERSELRDWWKGEGLPARFEDLSDEQAKAVHDKAVEVKVPF